MSPTGMTARTRRNEATEERGNPVAIRSSLSRGGRMGKVEQRTTSIQYHYVVRPRLVQVWTLGRSSQVTVKPAGNSQAGASSNRPSPTLPFRVVPASACWWSVFPRWTHAALLRFVRVSERLAYGRKPHIEKATSLGETRLRGWNAAVVLGVHLWTAPPVSRRP